MTLLLSRQSLSVCKDGGYREEGLLQKDLMQPKPIVEHFGHPIDERLGLSYISRNNNRLFAALFSSFLQGFLCMTRQFLPESLEDTTNYPTFIKHDQLSIIVLPHNKNITGASLKQMSALTL